MENTCRMALDPFLHAQRGVARPHGVILVGNRGAEKRHDAVAHHLVDGALVVMDSLHHVFEDRVEEFPCLFGITFGQQLRRALEVGEEHRHLLAFAFECAPGVQDFSGEVLGRVGFRGSKRGLAGRRARKQASWLRALRTEFRRWWELMAATPTCSPQRRRAF
jgi:hypothetical protein